LALNWHWIGTPIHSNSILLPVRRGDLTKVFFMPDAIRSQFISAFWQQLRPHAPAFAVDAIGRRLWRETQRNATKRSRRRGRHEGGADLIF
jgi:hypothetical protein